MRIVYTFAGEGWEDYLPRFTFFGYRYLSLTATGDVEIESVSSIPVTSIRKDMEIGKIETGDKSLNRFIGNVYWGQLSNYLSVPTDCPQRNERLGWSADTQVFCEAGAFNADTRSFFRKFTRDLRDSVCKDGGYPSVAPFAQYGNETFSLGWADAGVIVPWTIWRQFGDVGIVNDNWAAMSKFVRKIDEKKYDFESRLDFIYADWLSYETFETCGNKFGSWKKWQNDPDAKNYRLYLAACYWLYDARLMSEMGRATGRHEEAEWFDASAKRALGYIRGRFLETDGLLLKPMRHLQTANVFALKHGIMEGAAKAATKELLLKSIREHGDCLQTGFLGTGFLMDALTECGAADVAYTLLLQHKNPSWLYSVDQGATTVWERWNSYTKKDGFGPVDMNSFNHYAYGAVLAWMYRTMAGIAADSSAPGFKRIVMAPKPDRRIGWVKAEYKSAAGLVKSSWRYEGDEWIWTFTVPEGAVARVTVPGESKSGDYFSGTYTVRRICK
jgi:alpha-L-rhamnosidase